MKTPAFSLRRIPLVAIAAIFSLGSAFGHDTAPRWKVGAAAVDITPQGSVWLAGFGKRTVPSAGVGCPTYAKALAIEDSAGSRMVIVTLDLVGIPWDLRDEVAKEAGAKFGLKPESLLLNASHTHSAASYMASQVQEAVIYGGAPASEFIAKANAYRATLAPSILQAIGGALAHLQPANLDYNHARAGFAMNRRLPVGTEVLHEAYPDGPVDHDVPVLRVTGADGHVIAILFGYACHNTSETTVCPLLSADYAGFAQKDLQEDFPGAIALFVQGAAGDQNPYPRGGIEYPTRYGRALADAVEAALQVKVHHPVHGPLQSAFGYAHIEYAETSREDLERRTHIGSEHQRQAAAAWLRKLDQGGKIPQSYPCPVQVVRFGPDIIMVGIGGEPTVEYSLRLKRELGGGKAAVWFAGYSNDVFGYLGSREVLMTGGYEGYETNSGSSKHPGPYAVNTEDKVIHKVYDLIQELNNN